MFFRLFALFAVLAVAFANPKPEPQVYTTGAVYPYGYSGYAPLGAAYAAPYAAAGYSPYAYPTYYVR